MNLKVMPLVRTTMETAKENNGQLVYLNEVKGLTIYKGGSVSLMGICLPFAKLCRIMYIKSVRHSWCSSGLT